MRPFSLKKPILVPLTLALVLLLFVCGASLYWFQEEHLEDKVKGKLESVQALFAAKLETDASMMAASLDTMLLNKEVKVALKAKDRRALLESTLTLFGELNAKHGITHLYFSNPDRVNILRVHKPEKYGDRIDRFTTLKAEKSGRHSYGIELGPLGTFTLRVVQPWYDGRQLIGYVELGEEIEHITKKLHDVLGVEIYVVIKKEYLDREGWESGMRMLGRDTNWNKFSSVVAIDQTLVGFPEEFAGILNEQDYTPLMTGVDVSLGDRHYRSTFIPLTDAGGRAVGGMIVMTEVTALVASLHTTIIIIGSICLGIGGVLFTLLYGFVERLERRMTTTHERLIRVSDAVETSSDSILMMNLSGQVIYQNRASLQVFGYTVEEINAAGGPSVLCTDRALGHEVMGRMKAGDAWHGELNMRTREGRILPVLLRAHAIRGETEKVLGYVCIHTDISERKEIEKALQRLLEEQTVLLDNIDTQIWYLTDTENHGAVNRALADFLGVQKSDVAYKNLRDILSKEEAEICIASNREVFESKRPIRTEEWVKNGRGEPRLLFISKAPKLDKDGNVEYVVCAAEDITDRKRAEEALQESEEKLKRILENVHDVIFQLSPSGHVQYVTTNVTKLYGYDVEELIGEHLSKTTPSGEVLRAFGALERVLSGESIKDFEIDQVDGDGNVIPVEISFTPVKEGDRVIAIQGVMRDVTERQRAEKELEVHRDHLRELVAERTAELTRANEQLQREIMERERAEERLLTYHKRLRSLASSLSLAEERERRRIATEVHDLIGQNLAFAKLKLATLFRKGSSSGDQEVADEINALLDEAIQDTRFLISELGSPVLYELGFIAAAEWLARQMRKRHGIAIDFEDDGQPKPLADDIRVLLFQALRELLANVVRHAEAKKTKVSITRNRDRIQIDVQDDGVGFDPQDTRPAGDTKGFGLFSIWERLEPLGGQMKVVSKPGQGTRVTLVGPLKSES